MSQTAQLYHFRGSYEPTSTSVARRLPPALLTNTLPSMQLSHPIQVVSPPSRRATWPQPLCHVLTAPTLLTLLAVRTWPSPSHTMPPRLTQNGHGSTCNLLLDKVSESTGGESPDTSLPSSSERMSDL